MRLSLRRCSRPIRRSSCQRTICTIESSKSRMRRRQRQLLRKVLRNNCRTGRSYSLGCMRTRPRRSCTPYTRRTSKESSERQLAKTMFLRSSGPKVPGHSLSSRSTRTSSPETSSSWTVKSSARWRPSSTMTLAHWRRSRNRRCPRWRCSSIWLTSSSARNCSRTRKTLGSYRSMPLSSVSRTIKSTGRTSRSQSRISVASKASASRTAYPEEEVWRLEHLDPQEAEYCRMLLKHQLWQWGPQVETSVRGEAQESLFLASLRGLSTLGRSFKMLRLKYTRVTPKQRLLPALRCHQESSITLRPSTMTSRPNTTPSGRPTRRRTKTQLRQNWMPWRTRMNNLSAFRKSNSSTPSCTHRSKLRIYWRASYSRWNKPTSLNSASLPGNSLRCRMKSDKSVRRRRTI